MSEEEKKAIEYIKEFKNEVFEGVGNKSIMAKNIDILLNLIDKQQKEIGDYKKFKKDIIHLIMLWDEDEEELPENDRVIECLDTIMSEVSRLEDIEEKRDKYWKDKIKAKIKELENIQKSLTSSEGMIELSSSIDILKELLKEN